MDTNTFIIKGLAIITSAIICGIRLKITKGKSGMGWFLAFLFISLCYDM